MQKFDWCSVVNAFWLYIVFATCTVSIAENRYQYQYILITTVIGFATEYIEVEEGSITALSDKVNAISPLSLLQPQFKSGNFAVTIEVNQTLSTAQLGNPPANI